MHDDVNVRSTYVSQMTGREGLSNFCSIMDMYPPVKDSPYSTITKVISSTAVDKAESAMKEEADRIIYLCVDEYPEDTFVNDNGVIGENVAVSIDGTWQKRGHNSKTGVVFAISIITGEVLDYEAKTLFCYECALHKHDDHSSLKYKHWQENHNCDINHVGSSSSMETNGAVELSLRSIESRNLKYTTFVGDDDSSCFGHVKEKCLQKYGVLQC